MRLAVVAAVLSGCQAVFPLEEPGLGDFDGNLVFVTGNPHNGNLGGLTGADELCQMAADAEGLPGTFVAWLSDSTIDAPQRLLGSRGWMRVDGVPVADQPGDLTSIGPLAPIVLTEAGIDIRLSPGIVWTGTSGDGSKADGRICSGWLVGDDTASARVGVPVLGGKFFTEGSNPDTSCSTSGRLYCFGTGKDTVLALERDPDDFVMFTSARTFNPGTGVDAADTICREEAAAALLPGTFLAGISTSADTVASRFPDHDYVRVDGIRIGHFLSDPALGTFPILTATGGLTPANGVWTGGRFSDVSMINCQDWTSNASATRAEAGFPFRADGGAQSNGTNDCSLSDPVYCLQQ